MKVAAVSGSDAQARQPTKRGAYEERDLWQLVQSSATPVIEGSANEANIVAAFAESAPEGIEEEIARELDLKIVKRMVMSNLGLRVVGYRMRDTTAMSSVLERMRGDPRISSAQANVVYRQVPPPTPDAEVRTLAQPNIKPSLEQQESRQQRLSGVQPPQGKPRAAASAAGRSESANTSQAPAARVERTAAADVLTGGL